MSIADSMRLLWVEGITDCTGPRSWSTDKLFEPKNVTVSEVRESDFLIYLGNPKVSPQYFAHEADRFASAAFESLLISNKSDSYPRSTGWLLIQAYYAAFFSVHALLRFHGWACTRLSNENLKNINKEIKSIHSENKKFSAGLYLIKSENHGSELLCQPLDSTLGGTHEILWSILRTYFEKVTNVVLSNPNVDGQKYAILIGDFLTLINQFGGHKWFTTIRNRLNYAHEYGAWFPYIKSTSDYDRIHNVLAPWSVNPADALKVQCNDELTKYASACAFLVSLSCTNVRDLTYRSKSKSPFRSSSGLLV